MQTPFVYGSEFCQVRSLEQVSAIQLLLILFILIQERKLFSSYPWILDCCLWQHPQSSIEDKDVPRCNKHSTEMTGFYCKVISKSAYMIFLLEDILFYFMSPCAAFTMLGIQEVWWIEFLFDGMFQQESVSCSGSGLWDWVGGRLIQGVGGIEEKGSWDGESHPRITPIPNILFWLQAKRAPWKPPTFYPC